MSSQTPSSVRTTRHTLDSIDTLTVVLWSEDDSEPSAGRLLGIGRSLAYSAARSGQIPSLKIGGRILVPVAGLRRLLGVEAARQEGEETGRLLREAEAAEVAALAEADRLARLAEVRERTRAALARADAIRDGRATPEAQREAQHPIPPKPCVVCGTPLTGRGNAAKFCSVTCSKEARLQVLAKRRAGLATS